LAYELEAALISKNSTPVLCAAKTHQEKAKKKISILNVISQLNVFI
jgi:hypothetical protein